MGNLQFANVLDMNYKLYYYFSQFVSPTHTVFFLTHTFHRTLPNWLKTPVSKEIRDKCVYKYIHDGLGIAQFANHLLLSEKSFLTFGGDTAKLCQQLHRHLDSLIMIE